MQPDNDMVNVSAFKSSLYVVGLVFLLTLMAFAAYEYSPNLPSSVGRVTAAIVSLSQTFIPAEKIVATSETSVVQSGGNVSLSWTLNKTMDGTYSLSYPCHDNVYIILSRAGDSSTLVCGYENVFPDMGTKAQLAILSENNAPVEVPVTIGFSKNNSSATVMDTVKITVYNPNPKNPVKTAEVSAQSFQNTADTGTTNSVSSATKTKKELTAGKRTEKTYSLGPDAPTSDPIFGKADLSVKILAVGTLDKTTNIFATTSTTTMSASDRIAVRFEVQNLGTKNSGQWQFNAVLPTYPMNIFQSDTQQSLEASDRIDYTLGFDSAIPNADGTIVINVDPTGSVQEATKSNNIAKIIIHPSTK